MCRIGGLFVSILGSRFDIRGEYEWGHVDTRRHVEWLIRQDQLLYDCLLNMYIYIDALQSPMNEWVLILAL